jgi:hypothetical protein
VAGPIVSEPVIAGAIVVSGSVTENPTLTPPLNASGVTLRRLIAGGSSVTRVSIVTGESWSRYEDGPTGENPVA